MLVSLDTGDMEAGEKPMYSCLGFSSSTVQWVDGGVDAADGPQTSRGSTWLWFQDLYSQVEVVYGPPYLPRPVDC